MENDIEIDEIVGGPVYQAEPPRVLRLTLKSSDDAVFTIDEDVANQSNLLKGMISDLGLEPGNAMLQEPIPTPNIDSFTLKKLLDWCTKHRGEVYVPKPDNEDTRILLTQEDEIWMDVSSDQLLNMLCAANYLDIPPILNIITQKVANMTMGKSIKELREIFHLVNDFTPEEEESMRRRFAWIDA